MSQLSGVRLEPSPLTWKAAGWTLVLAAFAIGFINFPIRVVGWRGDYLPGDAIDNRLNNFVLEHGYRYLTNRAASFWDAPAFYPTPGVTACSDAHLGLLPVYAAFRAAGYSPEAAFQAWFLFPFALNFASAAWALRRLGCGCPGIAAGATVFTFALPLSAQLLHAQLLPRFLVPPAVVFGWEFLRFARNTSLILCLVCMICQIYVSIYIGYFLVLLLGAGFVLVLVRYGKHLPAEELVRPTFRLWLVRLVAVVVAGLALLPLAQAHVRASGAAGLEVVRSMAPTPRTWITPSSVAVSNPFLTEAGFQSLGELQLFPGFIPFVAVFLGLKTAFLRRPFGGPVSLVAVAAWSVVMLGVFVTHFEVIWLYRPLVDLPGGSSIRSIGRIVLVLLFPMAIVVAVGVDRVVNRIGRFNRLAGVLAALGALALVLADQWLTDTVGPRASAWQAGRVARAPIVARQNQLVEAIKRHPDATLLYVFPSPGSSIATQESLQVEAMRAAQDAGIDCVNGYSGYHPRGWDYFTDETALLRWLQTHHTSQEVLKGFVQLPAPDREVED